jgi:hypothetical protein
MITSDGCRLIIKLAVRIKNNIFNFEKLNCVNGKAMTLT